MAKKINQPIEQHLFQYYENKRAIENLNYRIKYLETSIKELEFEIKNNNYTLDTDLRGVSYSEGRGSHVSSIDDILIKAYGNTREALSNKKATLLNCRVELSNLVDHNARIESYIEDLDNEHKKIIESRYRYKKSVIQICEESHYSRTTLYLTIRGLLNTLETRVSI